MKRNDIKNPVLRFMWAADNFLQHFTKWFCIVLLAGTVFLVCFQVFARYIFSFSFRWSEEISRLLVVYSALLGGAWGARRSELARVTILVDHVPPKVVTVLEYLCEALVLTFALIAFVGSLKVVGMVAGYHQLTPAARIPKWISYTSVTVSMLFLIIFTLNKFVFRLAGLSTEHSDKMAGEGMV